VKAFRISLFGANAELRFVRGISQLANSSGSI
jgi:hypothetical protein